MNLEEKADIKCSKCKCYRFPSEFLNDKGRTLKSCKKCRELNAKSRERRKCPHGRQKSHCRECGGISICEHNRIRGRCKECGGSEICKHNKRRSRCVECGGSEICKHGRQIGTCKDCEGSQICHHNRQKSHCKDCMNDEKKIEFIQKTMISGSRYKDKKYNRYDADNFIDKCFLEGLFEDSNRCHYCDVEFTYNERCDTLVSIERLNNSIGHIKSNCVLACLSCNLKHQNKDEEKSD